MKTFDEALAHLISQAKPSKKAETIAITDALGRTLAEDIVSTINVPPHDNSMMDGYALNLKDLEHTDTFQVSQRIAAGETGTELKTGTIVRIFTGAAIPSGVNAVVMQEETERLANEEVKVNAQLLKRRGGG